MYIIVNVSGNIMIPRCLKKIPSIYDQKHKPQNFVLQKFLCAIVCIYFKIFWDNPLSMIAAQKTYFVPNLILTAFIWILNLLVRTFEKTFEP